MPCPHCKLAKTNPRTRKTKQGYATFYCPACKHIFNERTGHQLNFCHYPSDIIFMVVLWRLRYKLSLRDLAEMFLERGIEFSHEAVRDWEERFAPLITTQLKAKRKGQPSSKWHIDETYLKIKGQQMYLYRAIDRLGNLVDVRLSAKRDLAAAEEFFKQARQTVNYKPHTVTTDKHASYPKAIRKQLGRKVKHRTSHYLNNFMEQDHRSIKQRYYPMRGFKTFESASRFCQAFEEQRNFLRWRTYRNEKLPLARQRTLFKLRFEQMKREFIAA